MSMYIFIIYVYICMESYCAVATESKCAQCYIQQQYQSTIGSFTQRCLAIRADSLSLSLSTSFSLTLMIISQYIRIFILYDFHVRVHAYHICTIYVPYMSGFIHPEWLCCASLSDFAQCLDFIDRCFQMRYEYMNKSSLKHVFIWMERNFQNEGLIHFVQKRSNSLTMRFSVSSLLFLCSAALSDSNYHEYRYTHIVIENYISISRARFSNRSI